MDETGTLIGYAYSAKVIILRGRATNFKTVNGSREWVSQIDCIGIGGITIPPFIVFKGHTHSEGIWEDAREALGDCSIGLSKNGWLN